MRIRENDRLAQLGETVAALTADAASTETALSVDQVDSIAEGDRLAIGGECVKVLAIDGLVLTVDRGADSVALDLLDGSDVRSVTATFVVVTSDAIASFLGMWHRPSDFLVMPRALAVSARRATSSKQGTYEVAGVYQDGGGTAIDVDRTEGRISARLGLVIVENTEDGGHIELDVREVS